MRTSTWLLRSLLSAIQARLFERVTIDAGWEPAVRAAAERGTLIYALRTASLVDLLALGGLARRIGLPPVELGDELTPVADLPAPFGVRFAGDARARLARTLAEGRTPVVFLKRNPGAMGTLASRSPSRHGLAEGDSGLAALIDHQRRSVGELVIVPQLFLWTLEAEGRAPSAFDVLFGRPDLPGDLRSLLQAVFAYRHGALRAGAPLHLRQFLESEGDATPDDALVRRLTYALFARLERERRSVVGPARKRAERLRQEVLRSPRLRASLRALAGNDGPSHLALVDKAQAMLDELAADPDPLFLRGLEPVLDRLARRAFSGIDVDAEGMERIREASRRGVVVLLPSHKSHVDYLLLSWALRKHWLELPIVAAGDNLAFFPLGALLRRGGAFFIRRSFRSDRLYAAVVDAYVRKLLHDGWALEVFLEGGRSRTGKLRAPQVGLLNLVVDAALPLEQREVFFVPVSIGYERMLEEGELSREKEGGEKEKEDARSLLGAAAALREPWGRANVQIGAIFALGDVREQLGLARTGPLLPAKRRSLVHRIAFGAMREINRVTQVTAGALCATVLLAESAGDVPEAELVTWCGRLFNLAIHLGARVSPTLVGSAGALRPGAVRDALAIFARGGLVERQRTGDANRVGLHVPQGARAKLDLSKNAIVHLFVDRGLVGLALLAAPDRTLHRDRLAQEVFALARLFKHEFQFRTDVAYQQVFDEGLTAMIAWGEIALDDDDAIRPGPGRRDASGASWLASHAGALAALVEAYTVAARSLAVLMTAPRTEKVLSKHALREGARMLESRAIGRRESLSRPTIESAFASFIDQGILKRDGDDLVLAQAHASEGALAALEAGIARYIPRSGAGT